jgi:hypothetical protein
VDNCDGDSDWYRPPKLATTSSQWPTAPMFAGAIHEVGCHSRAWTRACRHRRGRETDLPGLGWHGRSPHSQAIGCCNKRNSPLGHSCETSGQTWDTGPASKKLGTDNARSCHVVCCLRRKPSKSRHFVGAFLWPAMASKDVTGVRVEETTSRGIRRLCYCFSMDACPSPNAHVWNTYLDQVVPAWLSIVHFVQVGKFRPILPVHRCLSGLSFCPFPSLAQNKTILPPSSPHSMPGWIPPALLRDHDDCRASMWPNVWSTTTLT